MSAAIYYDDGEEHVHQPKNIKSGYVVTGRRHHNCFMSVFILRDKSLPRPIETEQGFITNLDRFVNRQEGAEIAYKAGQTDELHIRLFSEDLY